MLLKLWNNENDYNSFRFFFWTVLVDSSFTSVFSIRNMHGCIVAYFFLVWSNFLIRNPVKWNIRFNVQFVLLAMKLLRQPSQLGPSLYKIPFQRSLNSLLDIPSDKRRSSFNILYSQFILSATMSVQSNIFRMPCLGIFRDFGNEFLPSTLYKLTCTHIHDAHKFWSRYKKKKNVWQAKKNYFLVNERGAVRNNNKKMCIHKPLSQNPLRDTSK